MRSLLQVQPQNNTTATRQTLTGSSIDHTAATAAHCRRGRGGRVVQRSVGGPPSTRPPRQQSSIPRAERLSEGSLLSAVGWQPADHFIPHYRLLSDLTRFPQLYAALAYNMCILLPSCQENPRSCPSTVQEPRWHASLASLATLAPRLWGGGLRTISPRNWSRRDDRIPLLHENPANFSTSPNLPPIFSTRRR